MNLRDAEHGRCSGGAQRRLVAYFDTFRGCFRLLGQPLPTLPPGCDVAGLMVYRCSLTSTLQKNRRGGSRQGRAESRAHRLRPLGPPWSRTLHSLG